MYILFAGFLAFALFYAQYVLYKRKWDKNLKANAYFEVDEAFVGDEAELTETIENAKGLPLPMVKMKLQLSRKLLFRDTDNSAVSDFFYRTDIYNIGAYQKVKRTIKFVCKERGYYDFHGMDVLSADLFFLSEYVNSVSTSSHLYVYPKPYNREIMEPVLNRINGEVLTKNNLIEDPFELKGIREYQTFDSLKYVNWKASAKSDNLMVNMHDHTAQRTIRIFLNLEDSTIYDARELKELTISMAVSCVIDFSKQGIPVSIYVNSHDILSDKTIELKEGSGDPHIRAVNRAFARIDLSKRAYPFEECFEKVLVENAADSYTIVISAMMQDKFQNTLLKLKGLNMDFCWICPVEKRGRFEVHEGLMDRTIIIPAEEAIYEVSYS